MATTFDKNAEKFVRLMIGKIEALSDDWSKPWFSKVSRKRNYLPQNLSGRTYSGGNAFLLFFLCEKMNYHTPIFITFNQAKAEGISIQKGAESFPVYYTMFCAFHKTTGEKITLEEYKKLTEEEQKQYRLIANRRYYLVFNLDQTNFSEEFPERWEALKKKFTVEEGEPNNTTEMYKNDTLDTMLRNQSWVCPIRSQWSNEAFFSPAADRIQIPLKEQFFDGESFYSTELHEMAHSTGVASRLNRKGFYDRDKESYGREELVAELTAALIGLILGISSGIREENAAYLKDWCRKIEKEPKFLFTVLADAMKATKYIAERLNISFGIEDPEDHLV